MRVFLKVTNMGFNNKMNKITTDSKQTHKQQIQMRFLMTVKQETFYILKTKTSEIL